MLRTLNLIIIFCFLLSAAAHAQIDVPQASPAATVTQQVGLTEVSITYSRPSAKGRTVMGGLVPYDKVWRTGANAAPKITLSSELTIGGKKLSKGSYALLTIAGKKEWTIIFSKKADQNGSFEYKEADDALRVKVPSEKVSDKAETFTMLFTNIKETSADLTLLWANTRVLVKLEDIDVDAQVMQQIDQAMKGNSEKEKPYFQAASYYASHDKDMNKALEWVNKAAQTDADKYWVLHLQAKINARQGNKKVALEAAQKSKELARKAGNTEYVTFNDQLISSLK